MNQDHHSPSMVQRESSEVEDKPQKSLNEKQQENQELLIRCVAQHLGFAANRPIAACIIYKCLLQWRSFEVERTSVFDRIIQTIGHAIEVPNSPRNWFFCFFFLFPNLKYCKLWIFRLRITMTFWPIGYPMPLLFSCFCNEPWKQVVLQEWLHNDAVPRQPHCSEEWLK